MADCGLWIAESKRDRPIRNPKSAIRNGPCSDERSLVGDRHCDGHRQRRRWAAAGRRERGARAGSPPARRGDHPVGRLRARPAEPPPPVGWSAAKGLAHEAGLDIRTMPSLMAAAAGASLRLGTDPVAACFDALRGQVYGAMYAFHPDRVDSLVEPALLTPAEFVRVAPVRPRLVVGGGGPGFADQMTDWAGAPPVPLESLPPAATMLLALLGRPGVGRTLDDPATAEPVYGRPAEAQAQWEARHGRPFPDSSGRAG
ncbi:MAG: hypothetical protein DMD44_14460 [Gemmatimonadetes bacterium]|nr:MAG: hypothetical protein DMD44_14460 [Gemmatimonadota bacterium]